MRTLLISKWMLISLFLFSVFGEMKAENNPIANPDAVVISGNMRFTVLTPEMVRIEWSNNATFEDRASFAIINRNLPVPTFTTEEKDGYLYIKTSVLTIRYKKGTHPVTTPISSTNLRITFDLEGKEVVWYPKKVDNLNLKGTLRTLDMARGDDQRKDLENGILSRSGWALIDEDETRNDGSKSLVFDGAEDISWVAPRKGNGTLDWYFLAYGHDYKKALNDFTKVAGKMPMPPMYIFGYWYSKYQRYTEQDFKNIVADVRKNDIPLDVMVVDMDWHLEGWTGWTWNKSLIPNPEGFINWMHNNNLKVTLNLHPADGIGTHEDNHKALANELGLPTNQTVAWNIENKPFYKAFFKHILRPHENIGVDFWWLDWQQTLLSDNISGLGNTFWVNYVFYADMEKNRPERRPVIFHRWGGLGNHRYPIGFSGDTHSDFESLAFQPYFTATASNVGYGYWSHDIGGHNQPGDNDPELYLRWIQYGIFSPVVRTHSTNFPNIERRIWKYPNFNLMNEAIHLRYAMIPYIYTYARYAYDTGISLCRPMYYDYPEKNEAYRYETQYMFGDEILVSPIVEPANKQTGLSQKKIWLPEGKWYEAVSGEILDGDQVYTRTFDQNEIPYYYKEGAIIPQFPKLSHLKARPDNLILLFVPGASGSFSYYEDANDNNDYQNGKYTFTKIEQATNEREGQYIIYPREGSFDGMPENRSYELKLLGKFPPKEVKVNDVLYSNDTNSQSGYWTYDADKKCITVHIPEQSCSDQIEASIQFSESMSVEHLQTDNKIHFSYHQNSKELTVRFNTPTESASVNIYNTQGVQVYSKQYNNVDKIYENLSFLDESVYICRISGANTVLVRKIQL